ncbi:MAG: sigma-70 family RNA polymerase sigma factor [Chloroflexi bacterium]|nr:sigma-70 family RNA polymerase sigma factor [Chloroflexota bacterium]
MPLMTKPELIASLKLNDPADFGQVVEAYQSAVYNLCYRMLGEAREAEDASQETFLRAYSQLHRYDTVRPFKTWLLSIASHHCIDRLRKRRLTWLDIDDEPLAGHPALRERMPGPEESAERREHEAEIQTLLAGLAPVDRSAVIMHYWYSLSYEEIAGVLGTTISAVKSRLHRARCALATKMEPQAFGRATKPTPVKSTCARPRGQPATTPFAAAGVALS